MKNKFAERLKGLRGNTHLTQRDVAKLLAISQVSYLRWEQGRSEPSLDNIIRLCEIFDVSADFLLGIVEV